MSSASSKNNFKNFIFFILLSVVMLFVARILINLNPDSYSEIGEPNKLFAFFGIIALVIYIICYRLLLDEKINLKCIVYPVFFLVVEQLLTLIAISSSGGAILWILFPVLMVFSPFILLGLCICGSIDDIRDKKKNIPRTCPTCSTILNNGDNFCNNCNKKID